MNTLPADPSKLSYEELAKLAGRADTAEFLPSLKINTDEGDDPEKPLPRGVWMLTVGDKQYFTKEVRLQIFSHRLQYRVVNSDTFKLENKSIIFRGFNEEIPDITGGYKCGKLTRKQQEELSEAEKEVQKGIKLNHVIHGLVSLKDDYTGEEVNGVLCSLYLRGANYTIVQEYLDQLDKDKIVAFQLETVMTLTRQKNGAVVYWTVNMKRGDQVEISTDTYKTLEEVASLIRTENNDVIEKWKQAQQKKNDAPKEVSHLVDVSPNLDLNDDIPF